MSTTIHIRGIAPQANLELLRELFERVGAVEEMDAKIDAKAEPEALSVFVSMTNSADAQRVLTTLNGKDFEGRRLSMKQASLGRKG